jgi:hypothetical protein
MKRTRVLEGAAPVPGSGSPIDFARPFIPEALTPLFHTRAYGDLEPRHRLRYNQLQALFFNEQIVFFETLIGSGIMEALLAEPWPGGFGEELRKFWADEVRHTEMFRALNRRCAPHLYTGSDFHFIRVARPWTALLAWTTRRPRLFPLYVWLMLLQEERSLYYSGEYIRHKEALEPNFVSTYRAHLIDEAGHVRCDMELLDQWWPHANPRLRRMNARLLAWMVREFFSAPKRGQMGVVAELAREFPELRERLPEIRRQLLGLATDDAYQASIYSREIAPRCLARFDEWDEFRVMERAMPGYRFAQAAAP